MAVSMGMMCSMKSCSSSWGTTGRSKDAGRRSCVVAAGAGGLVDQYRMLRVQPGASEKEVKKAFRRLALQYHPDVCKGSNCGVQFHQINEAYDVVLSSLRRPSDEEEESSWQSPEWSGEDLWEEWMGWEGAGIRDYSSHINPYI